MKTAALVFLLAMGLAFQAQNAQVSGDVRDSTGGVVPGARVTLTSQATSATSTATTNTRGQFRFQNLAEGSYQLSVTMPGFRTARRLVGLTSGASATANFDLQLGMLSESVTVTAAGKAAAPPASGPMPPPPAAPAISSENPVRPAVDPAVPVRVGGDIVEPKKIRHVPPVFPSEAQAAGATGVVILEATVDSSGAVRNIRLVSGVPASPSLDRAAMTAVEGWQYTPTLLNGRAVEVALMVSVTFQLR